MKSTTFTLASLLPLVSAICDHGTRLRPRSQTAGVVEVADFGFNELEGPLNWHGLDPDNAACAVGKNQSPINIYSADITTVPGSSLTFEVQSYPSGAEFENLGSTVEVEAEGTLVRDGKEYELAQFHFHTPSEHRVDSEHYPMEVHFVFQAEDDSLSVVGFLIELGTNNEASALLANVFENVDEISEPGTETHTGPLDFSELSTHLNGTEVFQYSGSLTTPPCTQGIAWNVVKDPIFVDLATYRAAKAVMKFNSRFTQNQPGETNLISVAAAAL